MGGTAVTITIVVSIMAMVDAQIGQVIVELTIMLISVKLTESSRLM